MTSQNNSFNPVILLLSFCPSPDQRHFESFAFNFAWQWLCLLFYDFRYCLHSDEQTLMSIILNHLYMLTFRDIVWKKQCEELCAHWQLAWHHFSISFYLSRKCRSNVHSCLSMNCPQANLGRPKPLSVFFGSNPWLHSFWITV